MKTFIKFLAIPLVTFAVIGFGYLHAVDPIVSDRVEYLTLRWAGRDSTHLIRPTGEVEFIGKQLVNTKKPERADERSFYMNIALNALARDGYELTAMTSDDYLLKRRIAK